MQGWKGDGAKGASFRAPKGRKARSAAVSFFRGFFFGPTGKKEKSSGAKVQGGKGAMVKGWKGEREKPTERSVILPIRTLPPFHPSAL